MTIDAGTGDGRSVLAAAAREPGALVIGLDADAPSMAEASRRAARPPRKGGAANALFVVAAAERIPAELRGLAATVTVRFPWASLLRGCLGREPAVAAGLAEMLAPGGELVLLLAPAERDRLAGLPVEPSAIAAAARSAFEPLGLELIEGRPASDAEVRASGSTWAKRLLGRNGSAAGSTPIAASTPIAGATALAAALPGAEVRSAATGAFRRVVLVRFRCPGGRDDAGANGPVDPRRWGRPDGGPAGPSGR
ncbi:MAG TPA: class I SAM-dependent methyltransferase [Candidatus Limnocylindrales bacterium]|nr:class I SAM-dependent methyltransferase [Candidatus Limnocylindrales bacterium]